MKKASTDLFDLIQALTTNEKAYFKRYAGMHKASDNGYLKLFEVIAEQSDYCEESVKAVLKNEKLVGYFSRAKKYLFDKILESMRLYNLDKNIRRQLWGKYEDAEFLYYRKQYKASWRLVKKIKEEAEVAECWYVYAEAVRLEVSLTTEAPDMQAAIEEWDGVIKEALGKAYNTIHFKLVGKLMTHQWNTHTPQHTQEVYPTFRRQYLDANGINPMPITIEAKIYHTRCWAIYHKVYGNWEESYQKMEEVIAFFEQNPVLLEKSFLLYYYVLEDLAIVDSDRFNQKKAKKNIEKIRNYIFSKNSPVLRNDFLKAQVLPHHYYNKLIYCFKFALHKEALLTIQESKKVLKKCQYLISETANLILAQIYLLIYITHENWEEALDWIDYTLAINPKHHKYSFINAQLWRLIIHIELENYQFLESLYRNTVRSWKQQEVYDEYLQKITKLIHKKITQDYTAFWEDLSVMILEGTNKSNYQGVDTLYAFAESRIRRRRMEEVRRELVTTLKTNYLKEKEKTKALELTKAER